MACPVRVNSSTSLVSDPTDRTSMCPCDARSLGSLMTCQASLQVTGVNDRRAVRSLEAPATRRAADTPARGTGDAPASGSGNPERIDVAEESVEAPGGGLLEWALTPVRSVIDAVKWAGASVNDVAVAPVMRLASPSALAGSLLTTLKAYTPQRARDLARVVGNVLVNFAGLARTPAGLELLGSAGRAAGSLSKAVSSPAGRQFAVDYASGLVKMAEALNTPEVKAAIQQGAVVMARGMDLLADSRSKFFLQVKKSKGKGNIARPAIGPHTITVASRVDSITSPGRFARWKLVLTQMARRIHHHVSKPRSLLFSRFCLEFPVA